MIVTFGDWSSVYRPIRAQMLYFITKVAKARKIQIVVPSGLLFFAKKIDEEPQQNEMNV